MDDSDLALLPAVELVARLRNGELRSVDLLELYLSRTQEFNETLNAIVTLDAEEARLQAKAADTNRAQGKALGALHGLPITVKDVFETKGVRTTAGSPELANYVPDRDAVLVGRLRAAGAIIMGKTNTPVLAADGQTFNPIFGTTNNPWDVSLTPGGSSGGCAAAVSTGMTAMSFGSDIAGSIRIPASFCGIYGHKPTFGLVPQRGHIPPPPGQVRPRDLNVVGPIARDAADLDLALEVLAGPIGQEALSWKLALPEASPESLATLRVAAWLDDEACPVDSRVLGVLEAFVDAVEDAGATVDRSARPGFTFSDAFSCYQQLLRLSADLSHQRWLELDEERHSFGQMWASLFSDFDILLCPVCSTPPFPHDQRPREERHYLIDGKDRPLSDYVGWPGLIGLAYLPSTAAPAGATADGLPVGVQVVGPPYSDRRTIAVAKMMSGIAGGYRRPPLS